MKNIKETLSDMEDIVRRSKIILIIASEEQERENGPEAISDKIVDENFIELMKDSNPQTQEVSQIPSKLKNNKSTLRYIIVKVQKNKNKRENLRSSRGKNHRLSSKVITDFSSVTIETRRH